MRSPFSPPLPLPLPSPSPSPVFLTMKNMKIMKIKKTTKPNPEHPVVKPLKKGIIGSLGRP
jgi:hypothetical protein